MLELYSTVELHPDYNWVLVTATGIACCTSNHERPLDTRIHQIHLFVPLFAAYLAIVHWLVGNSPRTVVRKTILGHH